MNNLAVAYDAWREPTQFSLAPYKVAPSPRIPQAELAAERPDWASLVARRLSELLNLPDGWDGRSAQRVHIQNVIYVLTLLEAVCSPSTAEPQIVPTIAGGLQMEWHRNGVDIEIEVTEPYSAHLFIEYLDDKRTIDRPLQDSDTDLDDALAAVSG